VSADGREDAEWLKKWKFKTIPSYLLRGLLVSGKMPPVTDITIQKHLIISVCLYIILREVDKYRQY
jgi:hypothetical protein